MTDPAKPAVPTQITLAANAVEADLIEQFEGFLPTAKWDVNAYRLGYGSDTEGPEQRKVVKGMTTTVARAFENLEARMPQFEAVIVKQVGEAEWDRLPTEAKAGLLSMGYNYGDLPDNVAVEVKTGASLDLISAAVLSHAADNRGVNAKRRAIEAQDIRNAASSPVAPMEPAPAPAIAEVKASAPAPVETPSTPPTKPIESPPLPAPVVHPVAAPIAPATPAKPGNMAQRKPINVQGFGGIQDALNALLPSEKPLPVDGVYGPETVARMKVFQASEKLRETGDTSFYSVLALYQALQKAGIPTVSPT